MSDWRAEISSVENVIISRGEKKSNHHKNLHNVSQMLRFRFLQVQIELWNHRRKYHNETIHICRLGLYCRPCLFEEKYKSFLSISVHEVSKCFLILFLSVIGSSTNRQRKGTLRCRRFGQIPTLIENLLFVRIGVVVSVHTIGTLWGLPLSVTHHQSCWQGNLQVHKVPPHPRRKCSCAKYLLRHHHSFCRFHTETQRVVFW